MKLILSKEEKKLAQNQLIQIAMQAGQLGDRKLSRDLMRVSNKFTENSSYSNLKRHEYNMLLDMSMRTLETLENEVIPKIEASKKSDEEKAETTKQAKEILSITQLLIDKLKLAGVQ